MNNNRVSLVEGVIVESLGEELIVLVPGSMEIVRLDGDPANLLRRIMNGEPPSSSDSDSMSLLGQFGLLKSSAVSRRSVLRAGAVATGAGIALLSFPSAAAASSTGPNSSDNSLPAGEPGSTTPAVTPEDALVLYVDAMNPDSYPGNGSTWFDLGPNNNDVFFPTNSNQHPSYFEDTGIGGSGLSWFVFDGNDYFDITEEASKKIANVSPYSGMTGYSVEAWVWDDQGSSGSRNIVSGADRFVFLNETTLQAGGDGKYGDLTSASFPKDQWVYVAFTYDTASKRATLFVDGIQKDQKTSTVNYVTNDKLTVGAHNLDSPTSFWQGRMTEVRIFGRELSGTEILDNYNSTKGRYLPA